MPSTIKTKSPLIFLILLLLVLFVITESLIVWSHHRSSPINNSLQYWSDEIKRLGSDRALEEFKKQAQNLNPGQKHNLAHVFGESLFNTLGLKGISVCDDSYDSGCYHSFVGTAIHSQGLNVIPLLNEECIKKRSIQVRCQHGIGHGIIADLGYEYKDLVEGLEICDKLPGKDDWINRCVGGIFMEYNFQTMLSQDGKLRTFKPEDPYYPCPQLKDSFRSSCYYWQARWWNDAISGNPLEKYRKIGELCNGLSGEEQARCFLGFGYTVSYTAKWDVNQSIKICQNSMPSHQAEVLCRAGSADAFYAELDTRSNAPKLCQGLSTEENYCYTAGVIRKKQA